MIFDAFATPQALSNLADEGSSCGRSQRRQTCVTYANLYAQAAGDRDYVTINPLPHRRHCEERQ
jgi:hypothetical protein